MTLLDLIGASPLWKRHWCGMPEFVQEHKLYFATIEVGFREERDYHRFRRLISAYGHFSGKASTRVKPYLLFSNFEVYGRSRSIWVAGGPPILPKYPIYIVSKGRAERQLTSRSLHRMGVPHYVVVERQELALYERYRRSLATLLVLDPQYQQDYDPCDDLGMTKSKGPGPARNFAWEHSIKNGRAWHWVMDDNIQSFYRLGHNRKFLVRCSAMFRAMEAFCERYENVYMAGPHYEMFAPSRDEHPAFEMNTRVYSCNLIRNDIPYRWRGRYNEDTDLSLRILKDGNCTVQFWAFLQNKLGTQRLAGGNTDEFYDPDKAIDKDVLDGAAWAGVDKSRLTAGGTAPKSQMLYDLHPDVTRLVVRFGRPHHEVDYTPFERNELRLKPGEVSPDGPNEFGMVQKPLPPKYGRTRVAVSRNVRPGMPDSNSIKVHFDSRADMEAFARITKLHVRDGDTVSFPS